MKSIRQSWDNLNIKKFCFITLAALFLSFFTSQAQESIPGSYHPEEYISLNRELPISAALEIINQFSTKYENKIIVDSKEHSAKIGVVVDNMHWKRALEYILRSNQLRYVEHPRHYEIVEMQEKRGGKGLEEMISYTTREVEIKAVFFEVDQKTMAEVGVDWSTLKDGKVKLRLESNASSSVSENLFSVMGRYKVSSWDVTALIKAFESCDKGQVIATPQIRIMEGEEGKIKVGKNFFLTTRDFAGNTRYSEYESGTILTVIPKIIKKGKLSFIHLQITAEKSDVLPSTVGVTKKITEGRTQVLLLNGEETAIAGLFSNEMSTTRKGVPILKDLPWWFFGLRFLFGYNSQQIAKKELIILIKAEIVPSIVARLKSKIIRRNYLKDRKKEFEKRLNEMRKQ